MRLCKTKHVVSLLALCLLLFTTINPAIVSADAGTDGYTVTWECKRESLNNPFGIAVDGDRKIYVADTMNHQIKILNSDKSLASTIGDGIISSEAGQFNSPYGIAVDATTVYVVDSFNDRIQGFKKSDHQLNTLFGTQGVLGSNGTLLGQFNTPADVARYGSYLYVTDTDNNRIQRYHITNHTWDGWNQASSAGAFSRPWGIAVDIDGSLYVADTGNNRIVKLKDNGTSIQYITTIGEGDFHASGGPYGIAVDSNGCVYAADTHNNRIIRYDKVTENTYNDVYIFDRPYDTEWGEVTVFGSPYGVDVGSDDNMHIADKNGNRLFEATIKSRNTEIQVLNYNFNYDEVNREGTISNIPYETPRTTFLGNLIPEHAAQTWNDSGIHDPVEIGDSLIVTAEDGLTTATYALTVNDQPPSNDVRVTSTFYDVDITSRIISDVPNGISRVIFLGNIHKGDSGQVWDTSGVADPVETGNTFIVTAEDGTKATYTVQLRELLPVVQMVTVGNIADTTAELTVNANKIGTVYWAVLASNAPAPQSDAVKNGTGAVANGSEEYVTENDFQTISVTGLNEGTEYKVYVVLEDAANQSSSVESSDAFSTIATPSNDTSVTSIYNVDTTNRIISDVPNGISRVFFLGNINKGHPGQTWDTSGVTDPVETGNSLVVTAEDGTEATYTIQLRELPPVVQMVTVGNIANTTAELTVNVNKVGTVYWVVLASNAPVPQSAAVKNGTGAVANGSEEYVTANDFQTISVTGLNEGTEYKPYVVLEDAANQISSVQYSDAFSTLGSAPLPMEITANVPQFTVGEQAEFTVSTTSHDDQGKMVRAHFTLPNEASVEYYEVADGNWYSLVDVYGPATGFPVVDATSTFRATFSTSGTYDILVEFKAVADDSVVGSKNIQVSVADAPVPMEITANVPQFTVGEQAEFIVSTTAHDDQGKMVRAHFTLPNEASVEYYEVADGNWYPLVDVYGPATGFSVADATSTFRATFSTSGTYDILVEFKAVADDSVVGRKNISATVMNADTQPPTIATSLVNGTTTSSSKTFTVTVTDDVDQTPSVVVERGNTTITQNSDGTYTVYLSIGSNTITITATDDSGKTTTVTRTVRRVSSGGGGGSVPPTPVIPPTPVNPDPPVEEPAPVIDESDITIEEVVDTTEERVVVTTTVTVDDETLQASAKQAAESGKLLTITIPGVGDDEPRVDEDGREVVEKSQLTLTNEQLALVTDDEQPADEVGLNIQSTNGTVIGLPNALLQSLQSSGDDLSIEVSRVSTEEAGKHMKQDDTVYGARDIDTNFSGETKLRFTAPPDANPEDLKIRVIHSDGTIEEITPTVVTDEEGNSYLEFTVDKFSTFIVYKPAEKVMTQQICLTIDKSAATINGEQHTLDAAPFIKTSTSRTLVPVRFVSEVLGAKVEWVSKARQVHITDEGREIILTIDSDVVLVDGVETQIDSPAEIVGSRTFVPLRFVSETLGAEVEYKSATREIVITK